MPERIRWIPAATGGRVERILVQPGDRVEPGTVLLELSNPDVQLEALDAERQLAQAQADLVNLESTLADAAAGPRRARWPRSVPRSARPAAGPRRTATWRRAA